nr:MAG TPA: hypothetical protein [Bacteriophage sp.]
MPLLDRESIAGHYPGSGKRADRIHPKQLQNHQGNRL